MSVLLQTSAGPIVVDLFFTECPLASLNFIKLCKIKYYCNTLVFNVSPEWIQAGDPTGTGRGGTSVFGLLSGAENDRYFADEICPQIKLNKRGLIAMASEARDGNGSRFFITLDGTSVDHLNGRKTVFGEVSEGMENTIEKVCASYLDNNGRPFRDIRILDTVVLLDPFDDPIGLADVVRKSSETGRPVEEIVEGRIGFDESIDENKGLTETEIEERAKEQEMKSRSVALEMMGDLPSADLAPPENVLFVCKLNPNTESDDLEIIFSRFGDIKSCEVIKDQETGNSLQYAFIEFSSREQCEDAYFKMNNVLIDDRRIKVDFSQSVARLWQQYAKVGKIQSRDSSRRTSSFREGRAGSGYGRSVNHRFNNRDIHADRDSEYRDRKRGGRERELDGPKEDSRKRYRERSRGSRRERTSSESSRSSISSRRKSSSRKERKKKKDEKKSYKKKDRYRDRKSHKHTSSR